MPRCDIVFLGESLECNVAGYSGDESAAVAICRRALVVVFVLDEVKVVVVGKVSFVKNKK